MGCLLSSAGIRQHPPETFGGANFSVAKNLANICHFGAESDSEGVTYGRFLREGIRVMKKFRKILIF